MIYNVTADVTTKRYFTVKATDANEAKAFVAAYLYTAPDRYPMFDVDVTPAGESVKSVRLLECRPSFFESREDRYDDDDDEPEEYFSD